MKRESVSIEHFFLFQPISAIRFCSEAEKHTAANCGTRVGGGRGNSVIAFAKKIGETKREGGGGKKAVENCVARVQFAGAEYGKRCSKYAVCRALSRFALFIAR